LPRIGFSAFAERMEYDEGHIP